MLRNYITIALRHFWANKTYVIVNIVGLAVAIAICILVHFHWAFNFQFNEMYRESTKDVYRIDYLGSEDGKKYEGGVVPFPLIKSLMQESKEIGMRVRYIPEKAGPQRMKVKDQYYNNSSFTYVDSGFFKMFKHKFIYGNEVSLHHRSGIILSDIISRKYFGNENPLGKIVTNCYLQTKKDYIVTGVVEQPANSMFWFDALARIENVEMNENWNNDWRPEVFVEIPDKKNVPIVQKQLDGYVKTFNEFNKFRKVETFKLISFEDAGNRSDEIWYTDIGSEWNSSPLFLGGKWRISFLIMLSAVALLILLIACFNYTNTSIALAGTRIKEISLRKVMGSQRKHIVIQFLLEHLIISLIAVLLSLVFAHLIKLFYIGLYPVRDDIFDFTSYTYIAPFLFFVLIFITFISGTYPAFYLSKLKTADALRRNLKLKSGGWFTYTLLTFQLVITVTCLGMGISFVDNINYINKVDKGFAIENIITVFMATQSGQRNFDLYKSKIMENPDVLAVSGTEQHIGWSERIEKTKYKEAEYEAMILPSGGNSLQTMGVKLKQGRLFEAGNSDDTTCVIINEKYLKAANITDPLNESLTLNGRPYKIIGVVGDFMQSGVRNHIKPMVIMFSKKTPKIMVVRVPKDKIIEVHKFLERKWVEIFDAPYVGYRQIEWLDFDKQIYETMRTIFLSVSVIALLLSLVGLYVLISLIINKKTKEIGIRKVMGSPIQNIIFILGKNFIYIFGIAILVGSLAGLIITKYTLDSIFKIENHVEVTPVPFLISSLAIAFLAACTISYKVFRAANANPVVSLKAE